MANLTYNCGSAREFIGETSVYADLTMTCQWNRSWTPSVVLDPCDWVACLKPPKPPKSTNLRLTGWGGGPIPFGEKVKTIVGSHGHASPRFILSVREVTSLRRTMPRRRSPTSARMELCQAPEKGSSTILKKRTFGQSVFKVGPVHDALSPHLSQHHCVHRLPRSRLRVCETLSQTSLSSTLSSLAPWLASWWS